MTSAATVANCYGCGSQWDGKKTAPVGSFPANAWGLHDMHGNVWEWVQDCWNDNYEGAPVDGSAWESGDCSERVLRGGSWGDEPRFLRAATASGAPPAIGSASAVSVLPGRLRLESLRLYLFRGGGGDGFWWGFSIFLRGKTSARVGQVVGVPRSPVRRLTGGEGLSYELAIHRRKLKLATEPAVGSRP